MEYGKRMLVLGATGGIGGAIAGAMLQAGWHVRGMARAGSDRVGAPGGIDWVTGDAMRRDDVIRAADGVDVIVHAVNPANYRNWAQLVLPMIDNTIAAARAVGGARVVLPGTIYNFDPAKTPVLGATSPQAPRSRKGRIRVQMEQRLQDAAPEVPALILRSGDFFGPGATRSSWFAQAMVKPGQPLRRIVNPARSAGHSWAYLPDLARAFALLLETPEALAPFERVQFRGLYDAEGTAMIDALQQACGHRLPVRRFPWWALRLLAPLGGFLREAAEITPYWSHPVELDNSRLERLIGPEPATPLTEAVRATLQDFGCLDAAPALRPASS
ncbi:NAD-dependent epimerase/dehydratase family protein [Pseudooceanicola aestuarii]|uniref:NAD-dependent epimerase/dehydratase family protein n=1 Tax=Pseudooceanicola aestuarii TaxID=2697319 RepID=UPI0013D3CBD5|nr:NAD-dependent epimerase/dehydratase family protein [Pseudooceanicola aestuarii]